VDQLSKSDKEFAEEVLDLFRRRGKTLDYDYVSGWYVEPLGTDDLGNIRSSLGLPDSPAPQPDHPRARYHDMLDRAMDRTVEGESFLGKFVDMVLRARDVK
jgi:hypothetical protein